MRITLQVIKGVLSYIPGLYALFRKHQMGGAVSASYCYEVWIKHLTFLHESGCQGVPKVVAELGPGDSIGVGLCALLSGADHYVGLDVYPFSSVQRNLDCLDELVGFFSERIGCPGPSWLDYQEYLDEHSYPSPILTKETIEKAIEPSRVKRIREQIVTATDRESQSCGTGPIIEYIVPWTDKQTVPANSIDLIVSHSVLEHVSDIDHAIDFCASVLHNGGWMSHQVDFSSHGLTDEWNGHWAISDLVWRLILGRRQFLINREPVSRILNALERNQFNIRALQKRNLKNSIDRHRLAQRFHDLSESDFSCAEALIQCRKIEQS